MPPGSGAGPENPFQSKRFFALSWPSNLDGARGSGVGAFRASADQVGAQEREASHDRHGDKPRDGLSGISAWCVDCLDTPANTIGKYHGTQKEEDQAAHYGHGPQREVCLPGLGRRDLRLSGQCGGSRGGWFGKRRLPGHCPWAGYRRLAWHGRSAWHHRLCWHGRLELSGHATQQQPDRDHDQPATKYK